MRMIEIIIKSINSVKSAKKNHFNLFIVQIGKSRKTSLARSTDYCANERSIDSAARLIVAQIGW